MLELCTLASGSSGNSLLVTDGRTHVLVDAGISCRRICTGLKELGVEPTELAGVLITHEHSDHISGLTTLTKQLRLPVYASPGTGRQLCYRIAFLEELEALRRELPQETAERRQEYGAACLNLGRRVRVLRPGGEREALAVSLTPDYGLAVRYDDGTEEVLRSGEVSVRGLYGYTDKE